MLIDLDTLRAQKKMTEQELAEAMGISRGYLSNVKKGTGGKRWNEDLLKRAAKAFDMTVQELLTYGKNDLTEAEQGIPVVGFVGAGDSVDLVDAYAKGDGMEYIPCPPGMDPKKAVAVKVQGDSMEPFIFAGWYLYYAKRHYGVPLELINKLCVVKLANTEEVFVKRITKGSEVGKFTLLSYNESTKPMLNQEIEWSAKVAFIRPE